MKQFSINDAKDSIVLEASAPGERSTVLGWQAAQSLVLGLWGGTLARTCPPRDRDGKQTDDSR